MYYADQVTLANEIELKNTKETIFVSIGGLVVNLIGLFFFVENEE